MPLLPLNIISTINMEIRDIVNRGIVNLTNCDEEPIHVPGTIQPHGFLLAVEPAELRVEFCSGNVQELLGLQPTEILGRELHLLFDGQVPDDLLNQVRTTGETPSAPLWLVLKKQALNCTVHRSQGVVIAEFEPADPGMQTQKSVFDQTTAFVKYMQQSLTLQQLCNHVAHEIRAMTGYDRVMIYRFDKDYNGEVFAEAVRNDLEAFLGLHYPNTDIPPQARQLYIRNLLRIIPDMSYKPVPIYTINDAEEKNLDLSLSVLRSVSPIHVQYLQNMGVEGTLTISLLHEGKLWGLVACHHYSPKYLSQQTRLAAQLQGHFLTSQINVREQAEEYISTQHINNALEKLVNTSFEPKRESFGEMMSQPEVLAIANSSGVVLMVDDAFYRQGTALTDAEIKQVASHAAAQARNGLFVTTKLADKYTQTDVVCERAAGLIYYSLNAANTAAILWFNPETLEEVSWAGNPEKAMVKDENGLHPRKSFEKWQQVLRCQARQWKPAEVSAATSFAYAVQKHVSLVVLTEEETRQRRLMEQLRETNEQLENINWISTHDLKEPLRKIQLQASRLLAKETDLSTTVTEGLTKMSRFADGMQQMITELMALGRVDADSDVFEPVDLTALAKNVANEVADTFAETGGSITVDALPVVHGVPVLLRQVLVNLVGNALKFAKKDVAPQIRITAGKTKRTWHGVAQDFVTVKVADNGIGFSPDFRQELFRIFYRLHNKQDYEGSGIGLALCKKIMQQHGGGIEADGEEGKGAVFTLYFPEQGIREF